MKKVPYRKLFSRVLGVSIMVVMLLSNSLFAQEAATASAGDGDVTKGKQLFNQNCAACHSLTKKMTGPPLAGVGDKYERSWLYEWIKNSMAMVKAGDERAVKIYNEYNQAMMTPFPTLSHQDIDDILAYTDAPAPAPVTAVATTDAAPSGGGSSGISNELILGALVVIFGLLVMMLVLVNKTLRRIAVANGVELEKEAGEKRIPIWKAFIKNQFLVLVFSILFLLSGAYFAFGWLMQVGVDQGYAPIQPIHYSHKIHAGDNQIDCKYCHSSARVSKTSGIPSLNVCMNCHKSISEYKGNPEGPSQEDLANGYTNEFYTGEIKKLYAAVGWDEENQKYTGEGKPVE